MMFFLCGASLLAQAPAPTSAMHTSDLGFSYSLPADWEVVETQPTLSELKDQQSQSTTSEEGKTGLACAQVAMTAHHGNPVSLVAVMALPFSCFGQPMVETDLPGFAQGGLEGVKKSVALSEPVYGSYTLGTHAFWIERAQGVVIGHPESQYTVEIACGLLQKGAVCWMTMASDASALKTFEHGLVTLDGEASAALVPATAFDKKPAS